MSTDDQQSKEYKHEIFKISHEDAYNLLKIRAMQEVEEEVFDRFRQYYRKWLLIGSVTIAIAGVAGYKMFVDYMDRKINASVDSTVQQRVERRISKLEDQIDKTYESGIYAKVISEHGRETISRTESESRKMLSSIQETSMNVKNSLDVLQKQLNSQDVEIKKTRVFITDLYKNINTEIFNSDNTSTFQVVQFDNTTKRGLVILRLQKVPIPQSVRLQYHIYAQPPNSYGGYRNLVFFIWGEDIKALKDKQLYIFYSADSSAIEPIGYLSRRADGIFAGNMKIINLPVRSYEESLAEINKLMKMD